MNLQDVVVIGSQKLQHNGHTDVNLLWHRKYGHSSFQLLLSFRRLEMVVGMLFIQEKKECVQHVCEACIWFRLQGKSRANNTWESPRGCLIFSFTLQMDNGRILPLLQYVVSLAAICKAFEEIGVIIMHIEIQYRQREDQPFAYELQIHERGSGCNI